MATRINGKRIAYFSNMFPFLSVTLLLILECQKPLKLQTRSFPSCAVSLRPKMTSCEKAPSDPSWCPPHDLQPNVMLKMANF